MMLAKRLSVVLVAVLAAGCSGGGASTNAPVQAPGVTSPGKTTAAIEKATVTIVVPNAGTSAAALRTLARSRNFVSAGTNYVTVTTYTTTMGANPPTPASPGTYYNAVTTNISNGSAACTPTAGTSTGPQSTPNGSRTCTIQIDAPAGYDNFEFQTYASDPTASPKPPALGEGFTGPYNVVANSQNNIMGVVDGIIASFAFVPTGYAFDAASTVTETFSIVTKDASNNTITAGSNDPYFNPITVTQNTTTGFPGTVAISVLDGTSMTTPKAGTTGNTVQHSTDTISAAYTPTSFASGAAVPPQDLLSGTTPTTYGVPASTNAAASQGSLNPITFEETGTGASGGSAPVFTDGGSSGPAMLAFTQPGQTATITPEEATAPGAAAAPTFTAALANCPSDTKLVSNGGTPGTFTITNGKLSTSGCTATFTDNATPANSAVVDITNTTTTSKIFIPPNAIFATESTTAGKDGFQIYQVTSLTNGPMFTPISSGADTPYSSTVDGIARDNANNVYIGVNAATPYIQQFLYTPGAGYSPGAKINYPADATETNAGTVPFLQGAAIDKTNNLLLVADGDGGQVCLFQVPALTLNQCGSLPNGDEPSGIAVDSNSNYYVVDTTTPQVFVLNFFRTPNISLKFTLPSLATAGPPVGIAVDQQTAPSIFISQGGSVSRYDSNSVSVSQTAANTTPLANCTYTAGSANPAVGGLAVFTASDDQDLVVASCNSGPGSGLHTVYFNGVGSHNQGGVNGTPGDNTENPNQTVQGTFPVWLSN